MKRKGSKRRSPLQRITVFAMSKKELSAFVLAVETLSYHVRDLRLLLLALDERIHALPVAKKKKSAIVPLEPLDQNGQGGKNGSV